MSATPGPAPPLTICIEVDPDHPDDTLLRRLPARPGVFALEDDCERTLCLAVTADVRRLVRARLAPVKPEDGPSRRIDFGAVTSRVRAVTVGSAFESDWAYLQLARHRLPATFRSLLDRWRGWFIHVNAAAGFPRFVKTCSPGAAPTGSTGTYLGPFFDKHAAQRVIEALQDGFDLCRYHHILVEAPHAAPCAYKEMGRCPAPCDGTITMDAYRSMIDSAVEYAAHAAAGAEQLRTAMEAAAADQRYEQAATARRRLDALARLEHPQQRYVDRLDAFRYVAILPSERDDMARIFVIVGGAIAPFLDVPLDAGDATLQELATVINERIGALAVEINEEAVENIGLLCWHLFRARATDAGSFLRVGRDVLTAEMLGASLARLRGCAPDDILDTSIDG